MANEVSHRHTATGDTLYFTIRNTARQMWNTGGTPNFETLTVANWTSYKVSMSESPASSYFFAGTFPAISGNMVAGWYWVDVFKQAGGSAAIGDAMQANFFGYWDGTTFKFWAGDTTHLNGTLNTARDVGASVLLSNGTGTGQLKLASGYVAITWADIAAPTTTVALTGTTIASTQHVITDSGTVTTVTNQLTAAQIATGVWQDTTAGDFTVASSIGKALYTGNFVPGAASGLAIVGSAMTLAANQHVIVDSGTVTTVSGAVGSISGVTFPTNFADLAITETTGRVTVGTNADKSGYTISGTKTTLDDLQDLSQTQVTGGAYAINHASFAFNADLDFTTAQKATELIAKVTKWYDSGEDEYVNFPTAFVSAITNLDGLMEYAVSPLDYWRFTANALSLAASQTSVDDLPTNSEFNDRTLPAADYYDPAADVVLTVWDSLIIRSEVAQDGGASSITLDASASALDDFYNGATLTIVSGTGAGQTRRITDYDGTTKVATVDASWGVNPDDTSAFRICGRIA